MIQNYVSVGRVHRGIDEGLVCLQCLLPMAINYGIVFVREKVSCREDEKKGENGEDQNFTYSDLGCVVGICRIKPRDLMKK